MASNGALSSIDKTQEMIESKIDHNRVGRLAVTSEFGGASFQSMSDVMEFSKLMAVSRQAVPPHCRNQPGICLGIVIQAIEWRMSPYAVANKSYVVNDRLSWESQLIHAVIEQRAPIVGRLRCSYFGDGPTRQCKVWATVRGDSEPLEYTSPLIKDITPKNSPLWKTKPDLQLFYNTSRDWARMYFPDVILGVYTEDELGVVDSAAADVKEPPRLTSRAEHLRQQVSDDEPEPEAFTVDAGATPADPPAESPESDEPEQQADAPPTMPESLTDFVHALHTAKTAEAVEAAFQEHVNTNGSLTEEDYEAGCQLRDWKLAQLSGKPASDGKLFDTSDHYE